MRTEVTNREVLSPQRLVTEACTSCSTAIHRALTLLHTTAISNRSPLTSITPRFLAQLCLADPALAPLSDLLARCFAITMDHLARLAANMVASADRLLDGAACKLEDPGLPDWRR